jgi:hypothetical protein
MKKTKYEGRSLGLSRNCDPQRQKKGVMNENDETNHCQPSITIEVEKHGEDDETDSAQAEHNFANSALAGRDSYRKLGSSLPLMLLDRERKSIIPGFPKSNSLVFHSIWQSRIMKCCRNESYDLSPQVDINNSRNVPQHPNQWRKFCQRRIPFTDLGTPRGDAVLSLDPSGSYVICFGGRMQEADDNEYGSIFVDNKNRANDAISDRGIYEASLSLRFYGLPSPNNQATTINCKRKSPLLLTIPIAYSNERNLRTDHVGEQELWPDWDVDLLAPPPALFPIRIWISSDGCLGVAITRLWIHEGWTGVCNAAERISSKNLVSRLTLNFLS